MRVAIPIFRQRISPVFDTCTRVLLLDIEGHREVDRKEIFLDALSRTERVAMLHKSGVSDVICGGISDLLENMLTATQINVFSDITGNVEDVVTAYMTGNLDDARFYLSGKPKDSR